METKNMERVPTGDDILQAHERIKSYVHQTPVMTSTSIDALAGCRVFFKCENFQKIGAFKARGAMNAVLCLPEEERKKGVATHSSGNHAQALARAARLMGVKSHIVMPSTAPEIKKKGVRAFGGEITECAPTLEARESTLAKVMDETGATEIHPFNNYDVIAGQATAAIELFDETEGLDFVLVPVGGGGLLSGTGKYKRIFIQPSIGTNNSRFSLALTPRISLVDFHEFQTGPIKESPTEGAHLFIEPAATARFRMAENLNGIFQLGVNIPSPNDTFFDHVAVQASFGVQLHLGESLKAKMY